MNDSDKIFKAFSDLTATKGTYHNKWICDESLVRILHMHYKNLKDIDKMRSKLVKRLNSQSGAFDNSNTKKLYAAKFQAICPFTATKRRIYYYYVGTGLPPQMPSNASPEAALLFGFDHGADVYNGLEKLIETFSTVLQSWQGYVTTNIIQFDNDGGLTHHAIFELRNKCLYLSTAYQIALEELQVGVKWEDCCNKAASKLAPFGFNAASNGRTIMKWNRIFRQMHQFPNPDPYVANGLKRKPHIFEIFPSAAVDMSNFILDKLDHFHTQMYKLVAKYVDTPPSYSTVLRWVGYLGFKRELAKKCYYVDGHEYPEQLRHRAWFTTEYLSKLEVRSHRWVHLTQTEFSALKDSLDEEKEKEMLEKVKYSFKGDNDEDMLEFHVDKHKRLQEIANLKYGAYGGRTSTRMDPNHKPVIIFGQDEAIFHAHLSMTHQWVDPNGRRALMPKTQGVGIMISGFQSRELGWGIPITKEQLVQINANRAREEYFDKEAALAVYGTTKKKPLESSPGIVKFPYGKENGCWTGRHMNLQTEDVIDVVKVTHGDTYEYVFLFDSSSGHAKKRGDGLDAKSMKKEWHSKPSGMRNVKMERKEGYLGPHHDPSVRAMVVIGQEQTMDFTSDLDKELGPFWLTAQQREEQRHDREVELPLEQRKRRVKQKSKGKGLLQVAYERGWIDKKNYKSYLVMKYDDDGNLIPELSLRHLIASCTDFQTEKTKALITTKYHAEYAGEGIEYSWGFVKSLYRRHPLAQKKTTADFLKLVDKCISREVLTVDIIRRFSARARSYMETYKVMELEANSTETKDSSSEDSPIPHKRIETLKKILKSHRAAIDFDKGFIMKTVYVKFDMERDLLKREKKVNVSVRVKPEDRKVAAKAKNN
ncbi:hypothetical protein QTG54_005571 [Skeletonema marinoi]|uniref:Uncharacterized protein n=1 Tax=Skeletonema marinoi TaxID=267567 RepID=A0AAD8YE98_9STRA|nr:hypothetical protein QTG54_005571 [Skeletonema marinoi]